MTVDLAEAGDHRLGDPRLHGRRFQFLLVVGKLQGIGGLDVRGKLLEDPLVGSQADAFPRGQAEVVLAVGADVEGRLQLVGGEPAVAGGARVGLVQDGAFVALPLHLVLDQVADPALDPFRVAHRPPSLRISCIGRQISSTELGN